MPGIRDLVRLRLNRLLNNHTNPENPSNVEGDSDAVENLADNATRVLNDMSDQWTIPDTEITQQDLKEDLEYHEDEMDEYLDEYEVYKEKRRAFREKGQGEPANVQHKMARKAWNEKMKARAALEKYNAHANLARIKRLVDTVVEVTLIHQGTDEANVDIEEDLGDIEAWLEDVKQPETKDTTGLEVLTENFLGTGTVTDGVEEEMQSIRNGEIDELEEEDDLFAELVGGVTQEDEDGTEEEKDEDSRGFEEGILE